jgi:hypothetical protein
VLGAIARTFLKRQVYQKGTYKFEAMFFEV